MEKVTGDLCLKELVIIISHIYYVHNTLFPLTTSFFDQHPFEEKLELFIHHIYQHIYSVLVLVLILNYKLLVLCA
jgi:hypothetical protein